MAGTPIADSQAQHLGVERVLDMPAEDICEDNVVATAGGLDLVDRDHTEAITTITGGFLLGPSLRQGPDSRVATATANSQQRSRFI